MSCTILRTEGSEAVRKRVLVTGGAGYIGSHTCKALAALGVEPVAFDNLVTGHRDAVRWGPFVEGDILDRVTQRPVPTQRAPRRPGDPAILYADPSLARSLLGFEARLSDIDTIVRTAAPSFGLI